MKKIILTLILAASSAMATAKQVVPVIWPFSASSSSSLMIHTVLDTANAQQSKYRFVFVNRPGAGGSIAANAVANAQELTVLIHTPSFYIRPFLFNESHRVDQFSLINDFCINQPIAVYSTKVKKITERAEQGLTIGINPGGITNLVSRAIAENNPQLKIVEVPYKGTPEATTDMLGGHIDSSVDFTGPIVTQRFTGNVSVLGITGVKSRKDMPTFQSQGIKGLDQLTSSHHVFVRNDVADSIKQELFTIFSSAINNNAKLTEVCSQESGEIVPVPANRLEQINQDNIRKWSIITRNFVKQ